MIYILFTLMIIFIIFGYEFTKKVFNPCTIFNGIWFVILLIYQFRLSYLQVELEQKTIVTFIICVVSFSMAYLIGYRFYKPKNTSKEENKIINSKAIYYMLAVWGLIEIVETVYSGGLPMIWKLVGSSKTYFDYGIPTVHGFANAMGLIIIMLSYYLYEYKKKNDGVKDRKLLIIVIGLLLFYLSLITRQVIISAIIQLYVIKTFFAKRNLWIKVIVACFVGIILFGLIGNFRTGYEGFMNVAQMKHPINKIFIGFHWVYMYLTMTVSNINYIVVNSIQGFGLYPIVRPFFPTVLSNALFANSNVIIPQTIVTQSFNVSGFFSEFFIGFGNFGVMLISAIYGVLGFVFNKKVSIKNEKNILYYAVFMQIIILSFFYNHLFYLPSGFQIVIIYFIFKKWKSKNIEK